MPSDVIWLNDAVAEIAPSAATVRCWRCLVLAPVALLGARAVPEPVTPDTVPSDVVRVYRTGAELTPSALLGCAIGVSYSHQLHC